MRIDPDSRSDGWAVNQLVRTHGERYHPGYREDRLWLVGWDASVGEDGTSGDTPAGAPIWSERQPDEVALFHRDVVVELTRRGVAGKLYVEQPFWYEWHYANEDEALGAVSDGAYRASSHEGGR